MIRCVFTLFALLSVLGSVPAVSAQDAVWPAQTYYRNIDVDGHNVFYREAGDPSKPTILFLHGYPASSHMFRKLIPLLSGRFHIVVPDNLGSGHSDKPDPNEHPYTFDKLADVIEGFVEAKNLDKYTVYIQDFGALVGFRLMMRRPEKVAALITQNGNAYLDGLTPPRQEFFKKAHEDRSPEMHRKLYQFTGTVGIKDKQYLRDVKGREEIMSPDSWTYDLHFLESDEQRLIQIQLLQDYYNSLLAYPQWQQYLRDHQPPTLIIWGRNDPAFIPAGGKAFLRDVPDAEFHLLDAGHFAMEEKPVEIAKHVIRFMQKLE